MEKLGIPVVLETWNYPDIIGLAQKAFLDNGVPEVRQVFTTPDLSLTSLKSFLPDLIKALTAPLTDKEKWSGTYQAPIPPRIAMTGTYDEVQDFFMGDLTRFLFVAPTALMTDGLLITPPTEERVARMLKGTSHNKDEVIPIKGGGLPTVESVAVNAVMAGCRPEQMPLLLAMTELGLRTSGTTDCSVMTFYVVSGPIGKEIGMNSGIELLSPGNPANMALERASTMMSINLAGLRMGLNSINRLGNNICGLTFAESDKTPWEGLNVDKGYKATDSVLIKITGNGGFIPACGGNVKIPTNLLEFQNTSPQGLVTALKFSSYFKGVLVFFTPDTAKLWKEKYGFQTMQQLQDYLYDNTTFTAKEWRSHYIYYMAAPLAQRNKSGTRILNIDHFKDRKSVV